MVDIDQQINNAINKLEGHIKTTTKGFYSFQYLAIKQWHGKPCLLIQVARLMPSGKLKAEQSYWSLDFIEGLAN
jgi:hypothetical protein